MARKLRDITKPLERHITGRFRETLPVGADHSLPPVLEIARRRGEALAVERFFRYMDRAHVADPEKQLELWQRLVADGHYLLDLCQRTRLLAWFRHPPASRPEEAAVRAWCILLHYLHQQGETALLERATDDFFHHHFLGLFPDPAQNRQQSDWQALRKQALKLLRREWGADAQLKESFTTEAEQVTFQLRLKTQGAAWHILLTVEGKRLKPTRQQAYRTLVQRLEAGECRPDQDPARALAPVKSRRDYHGWKT